MDEDFSKSAPASRMSAWARASWALIGREFTSYFKSTMAWLIMFFFFLASGIIFWVSYSLLNRDSIPPTAYPMHIWFTFVLFFVLTVIIPAITMRLVSEEIKSGTLESLATAPVTDFQIVISKYIAALAFYLILLAPTFVYAVILVSGATPHPPDRGPIFAGYLGLAFIGMFFISIGTLASSLTGNQIVAFIGAFMAILMLHLVNVVRRAIDAQWWNAFLRPFDFFENFMDFGRGVIDSRHIVYYLAMTALFLFLSTGALESRKWKI